ncbi:hypothetical protein GGI1_22074 [Acidithiobacillus sp. GGI-221]|nr:hypothetical protein GGI1_22074 [Acidithiobacillus sp. GGI-221]
MAMADALSNAIGESVATKADIALLATELENLDKKIDKKIDLVENVNGQ